MKDDDTREPTLPSITLRWTGQDAEYVADIREGRRMASEAVMLAAEVLPEPRGWCLVLASEADAEVMREYAEACRGECDTYSIVGLNDAMRRARLVQLDAPGDARDVPVDEALRWRDWYTVRPDSDDSAGAWDAWWQAAPAEGGATIHGVNEREADAIRREARAEALRELVKYCAGDAVRRLPSVIHAALRAAEKDR